jgi:hypothetical protein
MKTVTTIREGGSREVSQAEGQKLAGELAEKMGKGIKPQHRKKQS